MERNLDTEEIQAITILVNGATLPENERSDAVKRLLDDGLSVSDIAELAPTLLGKARGVRCQFTLKAVKPINRKRPHGSPG